MRGGRCYSTGIPADLTERSDLATRTIRLHILPIPEEKKRGDDELWTEFHEMGPRMFGAICDGLVAALRDRRTIKIGKKARMADFEAFAEAGCRTAFGEWTFVERYRENRRSSMQFAADADPIGRAVQAFMIDNHDGFTGSMSALLQKLSGKYRGSTLDRDWPKDATRLSTALRKQCGPLAHKGIDVLTGVDLRGIDGVTQSGVVLNWQDGVTPPPKPGPKRSLLDQR